MDVSAFYRHIAPLERRYPSDRWGFCVFGLLTVRQFGGCFVCLSVFSAQSAESVIQTIIMHTPQLYANLQVESKTQIQREFDILLSEVNKSASDLPPNWNSVGAIFNSARKFSIGWRYLAEQNDDIRDVHPWALCTAVRSVFRTTPLIDFINVEVSRGEDIPDHGSLVAIHQKIGI